MRSLSYLASLYFIILSSTAFAHEPSTAHIFINLETHQGVWKTPLRSLDRLLHLDFDQNGFVDSDEVQSKQKRLETYLLRHMSLSASSGSCLLTASGSSIEDDGILRLPFSIQCKQHPEWIEVRYDAIFELEQNHRAFLTLHTKSGQYTDVFSSRLRQAKYQLTGVPWWTPLQHFVIEGIWHIFIGYDHITFLIILLLPAVLGKTWRFSLQRILKIVTTFTIAHSITLSLGVLQIVRLSSQWVESIIAVSIVVVALENIWRSVKETSTFRENTSVIFTFGFGLIHGFGFASVLQSEVLSAGRLAIALFGFNAGVEIGQLIIVFILLPILFALSRSSLYPIRILPLFSFFILVVGTYWFFDRTLLIPTSDSLSVYISTLAASVALTGLAIWFANKRRNYILGFTVFLSVIAMFLVGFFAYTEHLSRTKAQRWIDASLGYFGHPSLAERLEHLSSKLPYNENEKEILAYTSSYLDEALQDLDVRELNLLLLARSRQFESSLQAISSLTPVLTSTNALSANNSIAWILLHKAELHRRLHQDKRFNTSVEKLLKHLELQPNVSSHALIATLGSEHFGRKQKLNASLQLRKIAYKLDMESTADVRSARHLEAMGELYLKLVQPAQAVSTFRQALKAYEAIGQIFDIARIHRRLAELAELIGSTDEAIIHYRQTLEIYKQLEDWPELRATQLSLARNYRNNNELETSSDMVKEAIDISEKMGDERGLGQQLVLLGNLHMLMNQSKKALVTYTKASRYVKSFNKPEEEANLWANLASAHKKAGQIAEAKKRFRQSLKIYRTIGEQQKAERVQHLLTQLTDAYSKIQLN